MILITIYPKPTGLNRLLKISYCAEWSPGLWSLVIKCSGCLLVTAVAGILYGLDPGRAKLRAQAAGGDQEKVKRCLAACAELRAWDPAISPGDHTFTFLYPPLTQSQAMYCVSRPHIDTLTVMSRAQRVNNQSPVKTFLQSKVITVYYYIFLW